MRLIRSDCRLAADTIGEQKFDLVYIDPPFFNDYDRKFDSGFKSRREYEKFLEELTELGSWAMKPTATLYFHISPSESFFVKPILDRVFGSEQFRNHIIWYYNSGPRKKKDFGRRHEIIFRYSKTADYYFDPDAVREPYSPSAPRGYDKEKYYNDKGKVMDDVWQINMLGQNDKTERTGYPTQKPVKLLKRIVESSCPPGGVVLDPVCGSGTTGVAALESGRDAVLVDSNPEAIEVVSRRLGVDPK